MPPWQATVTVDQPDFPLEFESSLDAGKYTDWQKAIICQDKKKGEYVVEFKEAEKTTAYRFNNEGRPVLED